MIKLNYITRLKFEFYFRNEKIVINIFNRKNKKCNEICIGIKYADKKYEDAVRMNISKKERVKLSKDDKLIIISEFIN